MPKLTFPATGLVIDVPDGTSLAEYCEDNEEVPINFGCRAGVCGTCCVEILAGIETLSPKTEDEETTLDMGDHPDNCRLACQLKVSSDVTIRQPD